MNQVTWEFEPKETWLNEPISNLLTSDNNDLFVLKTSTELSSNSAAHKIAIILYTE